MHIGWPQFLIATVALASAGEAAALGFGPIRATVVLGQPLNLAVPINLAEGESLGAECASAEVVAGDARLPPGSVRVRVTQGRDAAESVLRISTTSVVEEPVLTVTLSAGCPMRLSRTFVLLADPPLVTTATAPAEEIQSLATVAPPSAPQATAPPATSPPPARATRPATPTRASRTASSAPSRAVVAASPSAASAAARTAAAAPRRAVARAEPKSRLQLDAGQVSLSQAAVLAAQEQASAARTTASAAEAAASAAVDRMRAMESDMARVRADAKIQTDALLQLQQQLALDRAQRDQPSPWLFVLLGVAALFAGLAAWLGWRLRKQPQRVQANADWWDRGAPSVAPSTAGPPASDFAPAQRSTKPAALQRVPSAPAPWSDIVESRSGEIDLLISPPTVPAPTPVTVPPTAPPEEEANRAMSVDEQIDLEQQADFFIALGHDDAAIDLLMAHMRSTGGGSPLPFLKLLEIHRRRGQREAYERTRIRFNQRFNSVAPEWQADPKAGRSLEDYKLAIGRIQRAWASPLDVMAELEALLFRRGPSAELFDLPAYQEVLFLYQLARDLHEAEGRSGGAADVDVLLPIGGRSAPVAAPEGTIVLRPEFNDGEPVSLDLDLTTDHAKVPREPPTPGDPQSLSLVRTDDAPPGAEPDFWGDSPDARPSR
jgi:hypothetical protein